MSRVRLSRTVSRRRGSPQQSAQILGHLIQSARRLDSRSLEELAPLAALTVPEWLAIEAGDMPDTWEQILLIGNALGCGPIWMAFAAGYYRRARPV